MVRRRPQFLFPSTVVWSGLMLEDVVYERCDAFGIPETTTPDGPNYCREHLPDLFVGDIPSEMVLHKNPDAWLNDPT